MLEGIEKLTSPETFSAIWWLQQKCEIEQPEIYHFLMLSAMIHTLLLVSMWH